MNSVRRYLVVVLLLGATLIALVGTVGGISALNSARAVDRMVDDIRPAAVASRDMEQEALNAGIAVRAFALSGDTDELERYLRAVSAFDKHAGELDPFMAEFPERDQLRTDAVAAFEAWQDGYARARITIGGGPGTYREELYRTGQRLSAELQTELTELNTTIEWEYATVRSSLHEKLRATVLLIGFTSGIGILMLAVLGWWIATSIRAPLEALAGAVRRLRDGDGRARAEVRGPTEIREVAAAVNELADESDRARQVEDRIQKELREIDRTRNEFVSNVSHELRTPLTIIGGNLELLEDSIDLDGDQDVSRLLTGARRNVSRLNELIEDLLTLNSAENSGTTLDLVDVRSVVSDVVDDMRIAASARGVRLVQQPRSRQPLIVLGDANQLRRAILNLVSNAVKFSHDDSEVRLDLSTTDDGVRLVVSDTGIGIPPADLERVGGRFYRASNAVSSQIAGTGLGLRIVTTIINNHHGNLALSSELGAGTQVTIVLPLAEGGEDSRPTRG